MSKDNQQICLDMANLHLGMGDHILKLAKEAAKTGEPIVKPMALAFPDGGYELIKNQFVLGNDIIVAPVLEKGVRSRSVVLPEGKWQDEVGRTYAGGQTVEIDVPLKRLPYFKATR